MACSRPKEYDSQVEATVIVNIYQGVWRRLLFKLMVIYWPAFRAHIYSNFTRVQQQFYMEALLHLVRAFLKIK